jgi:hypothetical protein
VRVSRILGTTGPPGLRMNPDNLRAIRPYPELICSIRLPSGGNCGRATRPLVGARAVWSRPLLIAASLLGTPDRGSATSPPAIGKRLPSGGNCGRATRPLVGARAVWSRPLLIAPATPVAPLRWPNLNGATAAFARSRAAEELQRNMNSCPGANR